MAVPRQLKRTKTVWFPFPPRQTAPQRLVRTFAPCSEEFNRPMVLVARAERTNDAGVQAASARAVIVAVSAALPTVTIRLVDLAAPLRSGKRPWELHDCASHGLSEDGTSPAARQ